MLGFFLNLSLVGNQAPVLPPAPEHVGPASALEEFSVWQMLQTGGSLQNAVGAGDHLSWILLDYKFAE